MKCYAAATLSTAPKETLSQVGALCKQRSRFLIISCQCLKNVISFHTGRTHQTSKCKKQILFWIINRYLFFLYTQATFWSMGKSSTALRWVGGAVNQGGAGSITGLK